MVLAVAHDHYFFFSYFYKAPIKREKKDNNNKINKNKEKTIEKEWNRKKIGRRTFFLYILYEYMCRCIQIWSRIWNAIPLIHRTDLSIFLFD